MRMEVSNILNFPKSLWTFRKSKKCFLTVILGDLVGVGWISPPRTQGRSKSNATLGLIIINGFFCLHKNIKIILRPFGLIFSLFIMLLYRLLKKLKVTELFCFETELAEFCKNKMICIDIYLWLSLIKCKCMFNTKRWWDWWSWEEENESCSRADGYEESSKGTT